MNKILATPSETAGEFSLRRPQGDEKDRLVCDDCGYINYINPKIIVGAVCTWEDKFLLCERAIEPRIGYWTIPAGYMEENETTPAGAAREAWEEAEAEIEIDGLLAIYDIPRISQVQMIFRARLKSPDIGIGVESSAVGLYTWDEIPWDHIAFPTVRWALNHYRETEGKPLGAPFNTPADAFRPREEKRG
jgi:ADP-ribose pyrophosphatase YjhB (NUDIX family)